MSTHSQGSDSNGHGPAGEPAAARTARLVGRLRELELDALLVQTPVDVRYLTGYTGSNGLALLFAGAGSGSAEHRFFTDFRYESQSAEEVPELFEREIVSGELLDALAPVLAQGGGRLGFAEATTTVKTHRQLGELTGERWELVACAEEVARLRYVKEASEIARVRTAAELADAALAETLEGGLAGRTEREVALDLECRMRRLGAEEAAFPSIVAAGPHGALPHAHPRDVEIARDVLVTIDWGAVHEGYCSDCTRTYATSEGVSGRAREVYELVRSAQQVGLEAVRPGVSGRDADAAARAVIDGAGEGERYGHGLGHGVGLEIHEGPRLSRRGPVEQLEAGNVVTVEPGVYIPGELGVRIEDLVVLGEAAQEVLTGLPKALTVIS